MKTLDLASFPLDGLSLMEASAGTGKTYALSNLYLRYILEKKYTLDQILVVTFTEAATQELRVRVRSNIVDCISSIEKVLDALGALNEESARVSDGTEGEVILSGADVPEHVFDSVVSDPLQHAIFARLPNLYQSLIDLKLADQSSDLSEIHPIHGFCQKVAKENAVLLNVPSAQTLENDLKPLRLEVCQDLWRTEILKLNPECLAYIEAGWKAPEGMSKALSIFGSRQPKVLTPDFSFAKAPEGLSPVKYWAQLFASFSNWVDALKRLVLTHYESVVDVLSTSDVKTVGTKLKWLEKIHVWCEGGAVEVPNKKLNLDRFCEQSLLAEVKVKGKPPEHPFFALLEKHLDAQPSGLDALFVQALHMQVEQALEQRKAQDQLLSFDDLILQLKRGLDDEALARPLVQRLRAQYQVALIDEFQDTDAVQYPIFSRIFGAGAGAGAGAAGHPPSLVLIGDPKQAIYSFRGGDIATYLQAKNDVSQHAFGDVYTMAKNWRSSPDMIAAMNSLFGAHANPFLEENISYIQVSAAKDTPIIPWGDALRFSVLEASVDDKALNKDDVRKHLAMLCAKHVVDVLADATLGVQAKDLAILVRDKNEAKAMRDTLVKVGIKACFDDKSNVFASDEATSLCALLVAIEEPQDTYRLGLVLQNPLWKVEDNVLSSFNHDALESQRWQDIFTRLQAHWQRYGVLSAIRETLSVFDVLPKWKADDANVHWERILTNIGQLAEILQEQSRVHRSNKTLIHWLAQNISAANEEDDGEYQLRLESDEALVRIVTIHKSKGLEYPVVFLPFLYTSRESKQAWYYDEHGRLCLAMQPTEKESDMADRERLAEEMRMLYVALTRAKYRCYIGTCQFESKRSLAMDATALGYLVRQNRSLDAYGDEWLVECLDMATKHPSTGYELYSVDEATQALADAQAAGASITDKQSECLVEQRPAPTISSRWKVHSFTGLMNEHTAIVGDHWHAQAALEPALAKNAIHILNFPKGSQAGTFLHALFEDIEFDTGQLTERLRLQEKTLEAHIAELLEQYALVAERLIKDWAAYLAGWVVHVLSQTLIPDFSLQQLALKDYKVEAQFYFSVDHVDVNALNALIQQYNPRAPNLVFDQFEGHIKGAIDLMFRHDGRYYVLDYKSNHLGFTADDYQHQALGDAIMDHRYDLQYLVYSLAVHRLLRSRMGEGYRYQDNFGGVIYLFLRGLMLEEHPGTDINEQALKRPGVFYTRPDQKLIESLDALFSEQSACTEGSL